MKRAVLAWGAVAVIYLLVAATVALAAASWSVIGDSRLTAPLVQQLIPPLALGFVGGMLTARRSSSRMGWILLLASACGAVQTSTQEYVVRGLIVAPGTLPAVQWVAWLQNWESGLIYPGVVALILLLFPNGSPPSARWRLLVLVDVLYLAGTVFLSVVDPTPLQLASGLPSMPNPTGLAAFRGLSHGPFGWAFYSSGQLLTAGAVVALAVRLRRARGDEREQLRWVAYVIGVTVALAVILGPLGLAVSALQTPWLSAGMTVAGFGIGLPVAMGIAIFKYRLYDIDIIISRTLVYGTLAVLITGVYVGIAVGIGTLVGSGGKPNLALSILATAVVAIGFQPVRERLQRVANRLVYGKKATPYEVLSEFSGRLAETYAANDVLQRMARLLQQGTGAASAAVWLRAGDQLRAAAAAPVDSDGLAPLRISAGSVVDAAPVDHLVEVRHQGELLGALSITKRRGETLTPLEQKLVDDLAQQAGLVLKNVGLTEELGRRVDELRDSRQRLVQAQDQERRRLERNLHDGAQQNLVALKVKLGLAQMLAVRDQAKATRMVQELKADTDTALETLRDLARGIYPPLLAEKGLLTALESQARKASLPVIVDAEGIERYSQAVEATVYFSVLEALQNVQKYAEASLATVRLSATADTLRFEVEDDGVGFEMGTVKRGAGLSNMSDRVDALGGSLDIQSQPGRGTRVSGTLPAPPGGRPQGATALESLQPTPPAAVPG